MKALSKDDIIKSLHKELTVQDYSPRPTIEGVRIVNMDVHADTGGFLTEISRFVNERLRDFQDFEIKQINYSEMDTGVIKAAHLHLQQEDIWFIPPSDKLLVGLYDCRKGSETAEVSMKLTLGNGRARLLYIPRGVAHGAANLWNKSAAILYFVNNNFTQDPQETDEYRLPWDVFGEDFWVLPRE